MENADIVERKKVILLFGLAGSGKTTITNLLNGS